MIGPVVSAAANPVVAALDIGSNSFHMVIARRVGKDFQILQRLKEQVQLAAGLDENLVLDRFATKRAMHCLDRFSAQLTNIPKENIRAVATHTLRVAQNAATFREAANRHFPVPIRVVSGTEEARLIYRGVSHISDIKHQVLIMDIGGGSTEFIIGANFTEQSLRSTPMGCVNLNRNYLGDGKLSGKRFNRMVAHAEQEIQPFRKAYLKAGWDLCLGSSGSIKAVARILKAEGYHKCSITLDHLLDIRHRILQFGCVSDITIAGLPPSRSAILPPAVAILIAAFKKLEIDRMEYSRGALREGLLYDMIGE